MFFTKAGSYEGEPVRLYRSPMEIRRDIFEINERIKAADERLNIRTLLTDLITEYSEGDPEEWIPELACALAEAERVLDSLCELRDLLSALNKELEDTVWVLGA